MVSVIIVNYNGLSVTLQSISSVRTHSPDCEIIVVDNGSTDESVATIGRDFPEVILVPLDRNIGFGAANNRGVERASGDLLFFLNNDAFLRGDAPAALARLLYEQSGAGVCAPRLENADGSFQLSTGFDPSILQEWKTRRWHARGSSVETRVHSGIALPVDWVTGAALMIPAGLFSEVGGFDEEFGRTPCEDNEFYFRLVRDGHVLERDLDFRFVHDKAQTLWELLVDGVRRSEAIALNRRGLLGYPGDPWMPAEKREMLLELASGVTIIVAGAGALLALAVSAMAGDVLSARLAVAFACGALIGAVGFVYRNRFKLAFALREKGLAFALGAIIYRSLEMVAAAVGILRGYMPGKTPPSSGAVPGGS